MAGLNKSQWAHAIKVLDKPGMKGIIEAAISGKKVIRTLSRMNITEALKDGTLSLELDQPPEEYKIVSDTVGSIAVGQKFKMCDGPTIYQKVDHKWFKSALGSDKSYYIETYGNTLHGCYNDQTVELV